MKKIILFSFILLLTACSKGAVVTTLAEPTPDQKLFPYEAGLSFSISEDAYTDSTPFIRTTLKNESERSFEYGEYYHIEVLKEDEWYIMTHSDAVFLENPNFRNTGLLLPPGSMIHQTFSVESLGVTLIPGKYRLVKIVLSQTAPFYEVTLAVPFTVEEV